MLRCSITQPFTYLLIIPTYNAYHNMYSFLNLGLSNILATHYINRVSFFSDVVLKNGGIKAGETFKSTTLNPYPLLFLLKVKCDESELFYCPQIYGYIFSSSQFIYVTHFNQKTIPF